MDNIRYRPFNHRTDLLPLANLLEIGFGDELDDEGKQYIRQMRSIANKKQRVFPNLTSRIAIPKAGYICELNGDLVGNVSILDLGNRDNNMLVSIVVHPDYRQSGIARELSTRVIESIKTKRANSSIWLQVKKDNDIAFNIYSSLGFNAKFVRTKYIRSGNQTFNKIESTTLCLYRGIPKVQTAKYIQFLNNNYPPEVMLQSPIGKVTLPNRILWRISNLFNPFQVDHYSVIEDKKYLGTLSVVTSPANRCYLYLANHPGCANLVLDNTIGIINAHYSLCTNYTIDLPDEIDCRSLGMEKFIPKTPLIWMKLEDGL